MSIQITVIDPANTPRADLARVIALLSAYAGGDVTAVRTAPQPPVAAPTIDADDRPDVGQTAETVFGAPGAAEAFGAAPGNVPAAGSAATSATTSLSAPPAPPSAPNAAGAPATAGGVELDKHGLPWDGRIHAGTKTKKADGSWTARRGVEDHVVATVTAELRQLMAIPSPGNAPAPMTGAPALPPAAPTTPPPPPPPPAIAAGAPAIIPPAPAGAPATPPAPAAAPTLDFPTLAGRVAEMCASGRLSQEDLTAVVSKHGLPNFGLLFNRSDLIPQVYADIVATVGG